MATKSKKSDYRPWIGLLITSLFITLMTVTFLQKTEDLVKKRSVKKFISVDERLEPFGSVNLPENSVISEDDQLISSIEPEEKENVSVAVNLPKIELSSGSEHTIKMLNVGPSGTMVFDPAVIKVSIGDTIHFKSIDMAHNSVSIPNMTPSGAKGWTGLMNEDISVTLESEGIYVYQCDPHLMMAMVGVIQVGDATNINEIKQGTENLKKNFIMNTERLDSYLSQL